MSDIQDKENGATKQLVIKSPAVARYLEAINTDFEKMVSDGEREIYELEQRIKARKQALKEDQMKWVETLLQEMYDDDKRELIITLYCLFGLRVGANNLAALIGYKGTSLGVERIEAVIRCSECNAPVHVRMKAAEFKNDDDPNTICDDCQQERHEQYIALKSEQKAIIQALRDMPYKEYLKTEHWQTIRRRALRRSDYKCQLCNTEGITLDVHHRTYENRGNEHYKDVIVLCRPCHAKFHDKEV